MAEDDLEPLITECPNCATRFRVTEAQLQVASGRVRCGACLTVFHGVDHLVWDSAPEFSSEDEANSALEELLSELDDTAAADTHPGAVPHPRWPRAQGAEQRGTGPWEHEESRLFVGYEESPESELPVEEEGGHPDASEESPAGAPEASEPPAFDPEAADVLAEDTAAEIPADEAPSVQDLETGEPDVVETPAPLPAMPAEAPREDLEDVPDAAQQAAADVAEQIEADAADRDAAAVPADESAALTAAPAAALVAVRDEGDSPVSEVSFAPEPRRWWVGVAAGVGLLALAAQIFWYQFESWGRDPTLRPVYASVCSLLGCELPVLQDLKALRTEKLLVRSHPDLANALIVDAVIVNEADFAQPFPALELRFTTIDGNLVAGRRFKPDEYLAGELAGATLMPPKTPVRLELAIDDPGGDAVNYFLTFRSLAGGP